VTTLLAIAAGVAFFALVMASIALHALGHLLVVADVLSPVQQF